MQLSELYEQFRRSTGICIDTRKLEKVNIFFALKGEKFNANLFTREALAKGASIVVADEKHFKDDEKVIIVDDAIRTLQQLANYHRRQLKTKVIAVAGSNGKTTTKELIGTVLETTFKTFATKGNLNNHIGVPLSLLSISSDTEVSVIEIGANHLGETELLCEIAQPGFGIITNNGKDHLEGYGSMEGVRKGNGELYDYLRKNGGLAFVCADQEDLMKMAEGINRKTYGKSEGADCRGRIEKLFPFLQMELEESNTKLDTHLIGQYNFDNIMAAACIGNYFGVAVENIQRAISNYIPSDNRSQILKRGSNTFILDAYNANPSSMNAALENFLMMPADKKMVILGDMLELGSSSGQEHAEMILNLINKKLDKVILVGDEFGKAMQPPESGFLHFRNVSDLKTWFDRQQFSDYYFLLKGSRLIGLEKLLI